MANGTPGSKGGFLEGFLGGTIEGFEEVSRRNREDTQKAIDQQTEQIKAIQKSMLEDPDSPYDSKFLLETVKGLYDLSQGPKKAKGPSLKWEAPITYIDKLMSGEIPVGNLHEAIQFANKVGGKVPEGKSTNPLGMAFIDLNQNNIDDREEGYGQSSLPENMGGIIQEPGPEGASSSRSLPQSVSPSVREGDEPPLSIRHPDSPTTTTSGQPVPLGPVGPTRPRQQVEVPEVPVPPPTNNDASDRVGEAATAARDALNQVEMGDMPPATPSLEAMLGREVIPSETFHVPFQERARRQAEVNAAALRYEANLNQMRRDLITSPDTRAANLLAREDTGANFQQFQDSVERLEAEKGRPLTDKEYTRHAVAWGQASRGETTQVSEGEMWGKEDGSVPELFIQRSPDGKPLDRNGNAVEIPEGYTLLNTVEWEQRLRSASERPLDQIRTGVDEAGNRWMEVIRRSRDGTPRWELALLTPAVAGDMASVPIGPNGQQVPYGNVNFGSTPPQTSDEAPATSIEGSSYAFVQGAANAITADVARQREGMVSNLEELGASDAPTRRRVDELQIAAAALDQLTYLDSAYEAGLFDQGLRAAIEDTKALMGGRRGSPFSITVAEVTDPDEVNRIYDANKDLIDSAIILSGQLEVASVRPSPSVARNPLPRPTPTADPAAASQALRQALREFNSWSPNNVPNLGLLRNTLDQMVDVGDVAAYEEILTALGLDMPPNEDPLAMSQMILDEMRDPEGYRIVQATVQALSEL